MTRVFRVYGEFAWPPDKPVGERKKGVAEFHVLNVGGKPPWRMLMRWIPHELRGAVGSAPPVPERAIHIYAANAAEWFRVHRDEDASIWLMKEDASGDGQKFVLRGAQLFAQEDPKQPGAVTW